MSSYSREIHETLMQYPEFSNNTPVKYGDRSVINGIDSEGNPILIDRINDGDSIFVAIDTLLEFADDGAVKTTLDYLINNDGSFEKPELLTTLDPLNNEDKITVAKALAELFIGLKEELEKDPDNESIKNRIRETVGLLHSEIAQEEQFKQSFESYDEQKHQETIRNLGKLMLF